MNKFNIIGVDPSGSYNEGKGTTGLCVLSADGTLLKHTPVLAEQYPTQLSYWSEVIITIAQLTYDHYPAVLSIEDYVLYATSAKAQINSEMETSKLIGAITMWAYNNGVPIYSRNASQVMNRWKNSILEHKGIIKIEGRKILDVKDNPINKHCLDAIRHAVHCYHFELGKEGKCLK